MLTEQLQELQTALLASILDMEEYRKGSSSSSGPTSPLDWTDGLLLLHSCPPPLDQHLLRLLGCSKVRLLFPFYFLVLLLSFFLSFSSFPCSLIPLSGSFPHFFLLVSPASLPSLISFSPHLFGCLSASISPPHLPLLLPSPPPPPAVISNPLSSIL